MPLKLNEIKNINLLKYLYYEKHLVFDCDAPDNIQEVITKMRKSDNGYILDYSNLLFETWLVMHFQNLKPEEDNGKVKIENLCQTVDITKQILYNIKRNCMQILTQCH